MMSLGILCAGSNAVLQEDQSDLNHSQDLKYARDYYS